MPFALIQICIQYCIATKKKKDEKKNMCYYASIYYIPDMVEPIIRLPQKYIFEK